MRGGRARSPRCRPVRRDDAPGPTAVMSGFDAAVQPRAEGAATAGSRCTSRSFARLRRREREREHAGFRHDADETERALAALARGRDPIIVGPMACRGRLRGPLLDSVPALVRGRVRQCLARSADGGVARRPGRALRRARRPLRRPLRSDDAGGAGGAQRRAARAARRAAGRSSRARGRRGRAVCWPRPVTCSGSAAAPCAIRRCSVPHVPQRVARQPASGRVLSTHTRYVTRQARPGADGGNARATSSRSSSMPGRRSRRRTASRAAARALVGAAARDGAGRAARDRARHRRASRLRPARAWPT